MRHEETDIYLLSLDTFMIMALLGLTLGVVLTVMNFSEELYVSPFDLPPDGKAFIDSISKDEANQVQDYVQSLPRGSKVNVLVFDTSYVTVEFEEQIFTVKYHAQIDGLPLSLDAIYTREIDGQEVEFSLKTKLHRETDEMFLLWEDVGLIDDSPRETYKINKSFLLKFIEDEKMVSDSTLISLKEELIFESSP